MNDLFQSAVTFVAVLHVLTATMADQASPHAQVKLAFLTTLLIAAVFVAARMIGEAVCG